MPLARAAQPGFRAVTSQPVVLSLQRRVSAQ
jgi:hypothetical protein